MRHFVFIFLLIILPLHSTLSAATEYHHTSTSSEDDTGHPTDSESVSGDGSIALNPFNLDFDGDFFDVMYSGIASLPEIVPLRQCAAPVEQFVSHQQAVIFSKPPERPQWRLPV